MGTARPQDDTAAMPTVGPEAGSLADTKRRTTLRRTTRRASRIRPLAFPEEAAVVIASSSPWYNRSGIRSSTSWSFLGLVVFGGISGAGIFGSVRVGGSDNVAEKRKRERFDGGKRVSARRWRFSKPLLGTDNLARLILDKRLVQGDFPDYSFV